MASTPQFKVNQLAKDLGIKTKDITDILELGYIRGRVTLGVDVQYGTTTAGVTGVFVNNGGNTGLRNMDRIVKIGEDQINTLADYNAALKKLTPGQTVTVQVARAGQFTEVSVTVQENKSIY